MKTTNMKTISANMIKVSLLVIFTSLLPLANASAQKKLYYANSGAPIEVGDSVRINPDSVRYETGERKIKRVFNEIHEIMQVSSKYHPDAVLLRGIYSWIYANSILPENVEKKPHPVSTSFEATIDYGASYTWNDSVYTQSGEYTQQFVAQSGADSTVTLHLTVLPPKTIYTSFEATVEYGQTYSWNAMTYDSTGVYTQQFVAANGADSMVTLHLTVLPKPQPLLIQLNRYSVGVRGGFASTLAGGNNGLPVGFDVLLDLRYAHYWTKENKPSLGIMTGISVGYLGATQSAILNDAFTLATDGGDVKYAVTADQVKEKTHHVLLELPVMFSMVTPKGIFLNVGPKFVLPVYSKFNQTMSNPNITAYLEELDGKPIINEVVMGKVLDEQMNLRSSFRNKWNMSLALAAEFGYALKFNNGHSLDMGVYLDYTVVNAYKNDGTGKVIAITPPSIKAPAVVDVQSMTDAWATQKGLFDVGVKVAYNFDIAK
jgi:hypothetical protein